MNIINSIKLLYILIEIIYADPEAPWPSGPSGLQDIFLARGDTLARPIALAGRFARRDAALAGRLAVTGKAQSLRRHYL